MQLVVISTATTIAHDRSNESARYRHSDHKGDEPAMKQLRIREIA